MARAQTRPDVIKTQNGTYIKHPPSGSPGERYQPRRTFKTQPSSSPDLPASTASPEPQDSTPTPRSPPSTA